MARTDGNEIDGTSGGGGSQGGSVESVDIGSHIDAAIDAARSGGSGGGSGKRVRRTRAQLEADGYYAGNDTKTPTQRLPPVSKAPKGSLDVNSIQFALTGIHALLAVGMSAPELTLTDTEAETVAKNVVAVARHYDLQQTAKATDWGNLIVSLGVVYGGRLMSIGFRKQAEKKARGAGVRLNPSPVAAAPTQPTVRVPPVGQQTPGMPSTRPKNDADLALLNEVETFMVP